MAEFHERLGEIRRAKGMTQSDVADWFGIVTRSYRHWENGSREPSLENLVKLADLFDVTTDWLLGRTDER